MLNNCVDDTAAVVRSLATRLPFPVIAREIVLAPPDAHAGTARSRCMALAATLAGDDGIIITTDADSVAPPDWLAHTRAAFGSGADAVLGRAVIDPVEALHIPAPLHEADARECLYAALLDGLRHALDPEAQDPWPRHQEESGASLAVTAAAWATVGGMAPVSLGEDRAFANRLRLYDRRIRHEPSVWVSVSGRVVGRAAGGMADTIRRRMNAPDAYLDDKLEPAEDALRRIRLRAAARAVWHGAPATPHFATALGLAEPDLRVLLGERYFGAAWGAIEAASPTLLKHRVMARDVESEISAARALLARVASPAVRDRFSGNDEAPRADSLAAAAE